MATEIRELRPGDLDAYVDLIATRDGLDRRAAERRTEVVEWIAFHNPAAGDASGYWVAADGPRLLAHLGHMRVLFQMDGSRQLGSFIHDLYVDPEVRDRGMGFFTSMKLYKRIEKACPSFAALIWTNEINIKLQQARKYEQLWVERYAKVVGLDARIDAAVPVAPVAWLGKRVARAGLALADKAIELAARSRSRVVPIDRFDARFDELSDRIASSIGISPVKDQRYLNWRYTDWPHQDSSAFAAVDAEGRVRGFTVVCALEVSPPASAIAELVVDPDDAATTAALIARAVGHARGRGAARVLCMATDPRIARAIKRFLFVARPPREPLFLTRVEQSASPDLLRRPGSWHLSYGDSEGPL